MGWRGGCVQGRGRGGEMDEICERFGREKIGRGSRLKTGEKRMTKERFKGTREEETDGGNRQTVG